MHKIPSSGESELEKLFRKRIRELPKIGKKGLGTDEQLAVNREYRNILDMGWPIVPLLIREIQRAPFPLLFSILEYITRVNPVHLPHSGLKSDPVRDWVLWWEERQRKKPKNR